MRRFVALLICLSVLLAGCDSYTSEYVEAEKDNSYDEGYEDGYNSGYSEGYADGEWDHDEDYKDGYAEGYFDASNGNEPQYEINVVAPVESPKYDNGGLTETQVKLMQRYYGLEQDGYWGSQSQAKAGPAEVAWEKYQDYLASLPPFAPTPTPTPKPTPTPTPTPTIKASVSRTVYITRTGEKYHLYGCQYLRQSCIPIELSVAKLRGYTACSRCW